MNGLKGPTCSWSDGLTDLSVRRRHLDICLQNMAAIILNTSYK